MSAARHLPIPETVWSISVDSSFTPTPKGIVVQQGDTVNFTNNSGSPIVIQFASNAPGLAVSANLSVPAGSTVGFIAPNVDAAANYFIFVSTVQKSGPWAIQVGNGRLYISVTYGTAQGKGQCTPSPVCIPPGGNIEMYSTDYAYTVSWLSVVSPPFTPPLTSIAAGVENNAVHTQTGASIDYAYTVTKVGAALTSGNGGGTVKVKGT